MVPNIQGVVQEYKPWGGLAGVATGERRAVMDYANQQGLQEQNLSNVLKEVEARRAQSDYSNPDMELWRQQGIMGKNKEAFSQGELSYQTLDSNVKTKLAENLSKASGAEIDSMINGLDTFISTASAGNPIAMQQAIQSLPPQYQKIVQQLGPEQAVTYAKQFSDLIKEARKNSPQHLGKLAEIDRTAEKTELVHKGDRASHERIAAGNNAASRYAADQRKVDSQASERKYDQTLLKANPEARLGIVKAAIQSRLHPYSGEPLTQEELGRYEAMYNQDVATVNAKNNANTQNKPNLGGMGVNAFPQSNVGASSQGTRPPLSSFNK